MSANNNRRGDSRRRGAAVVLAVIGMITLLGMAALSVDMGMLYAVHTELQVSADAAALAAAWELLGEERLNGAAGLADVFAAARQQAAVFAGLNEVLGSSPEVDLNSGNDPDGDVVLGYLADPEDLGQPMSYTDPEQFNTVKVRVRRNSIRNGPVELLFAHIFGISSAELGAEATASFRDGVTGYEVTTQSGNAELLPLAVQVDSWASLLDETETIGDNYAYDPETGTVSEGSDGIEELNLYPGAGPTQLPPGNYGTVDIGPPNNSTADLSRQITEGVNADDLAYFGGTLTLGPGGTLPLNGDTGLSAAIKDELESIKGQPRAIPLFSSVSGPGNNATYIVVGFGGMRIMNVKLTGPMSQKEVVVQPGMVVDDAAITDGGPNSSYNVYRPVQLVR